MAVVTKGESAANTGLPGDGYSKGTKFGGAKDRISVALLLHTLKKPYRHFRELVKLKGQKRSFPDRVFTISVSIPIKTVALTVLIERLS